MCWWSEPKVARSTPAVLETAAAGPWGRDDPFSTIDCLGPGPREHLRLTCISSRVTMDILQAERPAQVLMHLWKSSQEIWNGCGIQVMACFLESLAPKELGRHLVAPMSAREPDAIAEAREDLNRELFGLDLTSGTFSAYGAGGGCSQWPGEGAMTSWQRLDLCRYPALSRCFTMAEEVEDELGPTGWGLLEHEGTMGQCKSVLYIPLRAQDRQLGVLRLATCSSGGFGAEGRATFASVVNVAALHLQVLHMRSEMKCGCHTAGMDCTRQGESAAHKLQDDSTRRPCEPDPEQSPMIRRRQGNTCFELDEMLHKDDFHEPLLSGCSNASEHLEPMASHTHVEVLPGHNEEVGSCPLERQGKQSLQSCLIPPDASAQRNVIAYAKNHERVAILSSGIKGFNHLNRAADPVQVMITLGDLFDRFDAITGLLVPKGTQQPPGRHAATPEVATGTGKELARTLPAPRGAEEPYSNTYSNDSAATGAAACDVHCEILALKGAREARRSSITAKGAAACSIRSEIMAPKELARCLDSPTCEREHSGETRATQDAAADCLHLMPANPLPDEAEGSCCQWLGEGTSTRARNLVNEMLPSHVVAARAPGGMPNNDVVLMQHTVTMGAEMIEAVQPVSAPSGDSIEIGVGMQCDRSVSGIVSSRDGPAPGVAAEVWKHLCGNPESEDLCQLRRQLRLAHFTLEATMGISWACCPQEILMQLWRCCEQIWCACDIQVSVSLRKIFAPEDLGGWLLAPTGIRERSGKSGATRHAATGTSNAREDLDEELFCLRLTPATLLLNEGEGGCCLWLGEGASTRTSDWQRLDLRQHPALRRCFEEAEEVEDELGPSGWGFPEHAGTEEQCGSILYAPLHVHGRHLGVLRLAISGHGEFGTEERAALASVADTAAARLQVLHSRHELECRDQAAGIDRTKHRGASAAYRKLLNEMLPSHVVDELCKVCSTRDARESAAASPDEPLLQDSSTGKCLQLGVRDECTETLSGHGEEIDESLSLEKGKRSLRSCAIPPSVSAQLDKLRYAENHECVAILFADIKGFAELLNAADPAEVMIMLDDLFSRFDAIVEKHGPAAYKVETIGDTYMIAFGLSGQTGFPEGTPTDCAVALHAVTVGAEMIQAAQSVLFPSGNHIEIRVGVQCGPVMSGIIGKKAPRYCMFGDTVNTASRMSSTGVPGKIHVTEDVQKACRQGEHGRALVFGNAIGLQVKGKGSMETHLLEYEEALRVGIQSQLEAVKCARCVAPSEYGGGADHSPSCEESKHQEHEVQEGSTELASGIRVARAQLWKEERLHMISCSASMERLAASEDPSQLRQQLCLAHIAADISRDIFRARCPQEILMQLWRCCNQIWTEHHVQVNVNLRRILAPKELARHLSAPTVEARGGLDGELFCLGLEPATRSADASRGSCCEWLGRTAHFRASDWQRLDLGQHPALRRCFEEAEEVEDEVGSDGWGLRQHDGIVEENRSVLYVPFGIRGRSLGVLALATRSPGGFRTAERSAFALVADMAARHLHGMHVNYEMECRCRAAEMDCMQHKETSAAYGKLLREMLPSHVVDEVCGVSGRRSGHRHEPKPEGSLAMRPGGEDARFEPGKQSLQSCAIPASATAQLNKLAYAENHDCVGILFADIKGFTKLSSRAVPAEIMVMLDELFGRFDAIVERHAPVAYKVETIGDAYMIAFGLFGQAGFAEGKPTDYAVVMHAITVGAEMIRAAQLVSSPSGDPIEIRVGVHCGRVMSGIVGRKGSRYCMFGDTVSTASRMESLGTPGKIHVTERARRACRQGEHGQALAFCSAGRLEVKGLVETFLLEFEQVLGVGFRPRLGAMERDAAKPGPRKDGSVAERRPSSKKPWHGHEEELRRRFALQKWSSGGQALGKSTADPDAAIKAERQLIRHLQVPRDTQQPSLTGRPALSTAADAREDRGEEPPSLDLAPAALSTDEVGAGRCRWLGESAHTCALDWQQWGLCQHPPLQHHFEEAKAVEDRLGPDGRGLEDRLDPNRLGPNARPKHGVAADQSPNCGNPWDEEEEVRGCSVVQGLRSVRQVAITEFWQGGRLHGKHRPFSAEHLTTSKNPHALGQHPHLAHIAFRITRHTSQTECWLRCNRKVQRPQNRQRQKPEAGESPEAHLRQESAHIEPGTLLPKDECNEHLPREDHNFSQHLHPEVSRVCVEVALGRGGKVRVSPAVKSGERRLQPRGIPSGASTQLEGHTSSKSRAPAAVSSDFKGFDCFGHVDHPASMEYLPASKDLRQSRRHVRAAHIAPRVTTGPSRSSAKSMSHCVRGGPAGWGNRGGPLRRRRPAGSGKEVYRTPIPARAQADAWRGLPATVWDPGARRVHGSAREELPPRPRPKP